MSRLFGRRRHPALKPPPTPDPNNLERARRELQNSGEVLRQVWSRDREITERAERARRIHRENHLGPSFWRAMEGRGA